MGHAQAGQDFPCLDVPFYSALWAVGCTPTVGLSCSGLFSKEWFRPCVVGDEGSNPRYGDLGHVL